MISTKALYAGTLAAASLAGFSAGWAARPAEIVVVSERDRLLAEFQRDYSLSPSDREALVIVLDEHFSEVDALRAEYEARYGDRVGNLQDRTDRRLKVILTPEKKKRP